MIPELDRRRLLTRVKGRGALERRIRGLLIAVHRFGRARAQSIADQRFCARTIAALEGVLAESNGAAVHEPHTRGAPRSEWEGGA